MKDYIQRKELGDLAHISHLHGSPGPLPLMRHVNSACKASKPPDTLVFAARMQYLLKAAAHPY